MSFLCVSSPDPYNLASKLVILTNHWNRLILEIYITLNACMS